MDVETSGVDCGTIVVHAVLGGKVSTVAYVGLVVIV